MRDDLALAPTAAAPWSFSSTGGVPRGASTNSTGGGGGGNPKRPLASLHHRHNSGGGGDDSNTMMMVECDAADRNDNRKPSVSTVSPWSSSAISTTSNKRSRPTPTLSGLRRRLAARLVQAVQRTPHSISSNFDNGSSVLTTVAECLHGEELRVAASAIPGGPLAHVPHGLFFADGRPAPLAKICHPNSSPAHATVTEWRLEGADAAEWIRSALGGGAAAAAAAAAPMADDDRGGPYRIHPVPYDGFRVGQRNHLLKRERMYAYAAVEAIEARFETTLIPGDNGYGRNGNGGRLTLTVTTRLAGLVEESAVTFNPWG